MLYGIEKHSQLFWHCIFVSIWSPYIYVLYISYVYGLFYVNTIFVTSSVMLDAPYTFRPYI